MKTTELFVEHVIIGFLLLFIIVLPFGDFVLDYGNAVAGKVSQHFATAVAIAVFSVLVAAAYLIGIVCDRCTDTLLQDLEQHSRLSFAEEQWRRLAAAPGGRAQDPHPENLYRAALLGNSDATAYAEFLRARIRLTRALTTLSPALGMSMLLYFVRDGRGQPWWTYGLAALGIVYAVALLTKIAVPLGYRPPKTTEGHAKLEKYFKLRGNAPGQARLVLSDAAVWVLVLLTAIGIVITRVHRRDLLWVPVAAAGLSVLSGWCWWRMLKTFAQFLRDYWRFGRRVAGGATAV